MNIREIVERYRQDPLWFMENHLWIEQKDYRKIVQFSLNNVQRDYLWPHFKKQLDKDGMIRSVILKARRMGASTLVAGHIFPETIFNRNIDSCVIAHDLKSANFIYKIYKTYFDRLEEELRPMVKYDNKREMIFDNPKRGGERGINSQISVMSADDKKKEAGIGRGGTINHVHGSEVAFWKAAASEILTAIGQSVPHIPGTSIILESTAAAAGGAFYDEYWRAKENPDTRYEAIFVPWYAMDSYRLSLEPDETPDLDIEEHKLHTVHGVSLEAIKWRRRTIADECHGKISKFRREYPSTDVEAFTVQGKSVFPYSLLLGHLEYARAQKPRQRYEVVRGVLTPKVDGPLKIYKTPSMGRKYVVSCDPAEGTADNCLQTIEVIDAATFDQVAEWAWRTNIYDYARACVGVAQYFNGALLVVESNNHGLAVIQKVRDIGYFNLYRQEDFTKTQHGPSAVAKTGWYTTGQSKQMIEQFFDSMLYEGDLIMNSPELVQEAMEYVYDPHGSTGPDAGPPEGKFSDRLMAYMIGLYVTNRRFPRRRAESSMMAVRNFIQNGPPVEEHGYSPPALMDVIRETKRKPRSDTTISRSVAPLSYRR